MTKLKTAICVPVAPGSPMPYRQCSDCSRNVLTFDGPRRPEQHPPALVNGECPSRLEINAKITGLSG